MQWLLYCARPVHLVRYRGRPVWGKVDQGLPTRLSKYPLCGFSLYSYLLNYFGLFRCSTCRQPNRWYRRRTILPRCTRSHTDCQSLRKSASEPWLGLHWALTLSPDSSVTLRLLVEWYISAILPLQCDYFHSYTCQNDSEPSRRTLKLSQLVLTLNEIEMQVQLTLSVGVPQ